MYMCLRDVHFFCFYDLRLDCGAVLIDCSFFSFHDDQTCVITSLFEVHGTHMGSHLFQYFEQDMLKLIGYYQRQPTGAFALCCDPC
jgi:hypothetical protein